MIQLLIVVLIGLLIYMALGNDIKRVAQRRTESYRVKYRKYLTRPVLMPAIIFLVLGFLMRDLLLTPFLLVVGGMLSYMRLRQVIEQLGTITPRQVSQLVIAFRGAYQLEPAAFKSLEQTAKKVGEPIRSLLETTVNIFFTTSEPVRAYEAFRSRTDNVLLHQFIYILEMSESASDTSVAESLDAFAARLRQQEELQRQVETSLSSITGQTSFMQGLAILIAFVVALIPGFRNAYAGSVLGRLGYMILVSIIAGASYMIDKQVLMLKERIL